MRSIEVSRLIDRFNACLAAYPPASLQPHLRLLISNLALDTPLALVAPTLTRRRVSSRHDGGALGASQSGGGDVNGGMGSSSDEDVQAILDVPSFDIVAMERSLSLALSVSSAAYEEPLTHAHTGSSTMQHDNNTPRELDLCSLDHRTLQFALTTPVLAPVLASLHAVTLNLAPEITSWDTIACHFASLRVLKVDNCLSSPQGVRFLERVLRQNHATIMVLELYHSATEPPQPLADSTIDALLGLTGLMQWTVSRIAIAAHLGLLSPLLSRLAIMTADECDISSSAAGVLAELRATHPRLLLLQRASSLELQRQTRQQRSMQHMLLTGEFLGTLSSTY